MKCPFCAERVDDEATVCKTCRRDISVSRPLMEAKRALEAKVEALEAQLAERTAIAETYKLSLEQATRSTSAVQMAAVYGLLPIATILLLYVVLYLNLGINERWLRVVSPVPAIVFGYAMEARRRPSWVAKGYFAAVIGVASVLAMSGMQHVIYGTAVLPEGRFEQIENLEYMLSIALGFVLGSLVARGTRVVRLPSLERPHGFAAAVALFLAHNMPHREGTHIEQRIARWEGHVRTAVTVITAVGMIYTAFTKFFPHSH